MLWLRVVTVFFFIIGGLSQTTVVSRHVTEVSNGLLPGGVVIIGGFEATIPSETLFTPELPSFPAIVAANTVSIVGSTVFSCGGNSVKYERACYYLKAEDPNWHFIALPWPLWYHISVTVQNKTIWFLQDSKLYSYDTTIRNDQFREYSLGFTFKNGFCAVTNQSHTFIIGAGEGDDEVWVNRNPSKPTEWEKVANMLGEGGLPPSCLWFGNEIFMTGGRRDGLLDSVDVLNVTDMTIRSRSPLIRGRLGHKMAVLHGKPAVLGGAVDNAPSASIEVYEVKKDTWQTLNYTMKERRFAFGLAQYQS